MALRCPGKQPLTETNSDTLSILSLRQRQAFRRRQVREPGGRELRDCAAEQQRKFFREQLDNIERKHVFYQNAGDPYRRSCESSSRVTFSCDCVAYFLGDQDGGGYSYERCWGCEAETDVFLMCSDLLCELGLQGSYFSSAGTLSHFPVGEESFCGLCAH